MQINLDLLLDDISKLMHYLVRNEKQSSMETLSDLYTFAGFFEEITRVEINTDIFMDKDKINKYLLKYYLDGVKKFTSFFNSNDKDLLKLANNIDSFIDKESVIHIYNDSYKTLNKSKIYSEKEFKEIIYDFYSQYGNNIFNAVRKMFDEKRISMGYYMGSKKDGYTVSSPFTKSSYIVTGSDYFAVDSMILLVHELGHAAIFYTSSMYTSEKNPDMSAFIEVPSCSFELSFLDYLIKNHIEGESALTILNDKIATDFISLKKYSEISDSVDFFIDDEGYIHGNDLPQNLIGSNLADDLKYTLGYSIALNLILTYCNNPKEVAKRLNDFVYYCNTKHLDEVVNKLGINYEDYISCKIIGPYIKEKNEALIRKFKKV